MNQGPREIVLGEVLTYLSAESGIDNLQLGGGVTARVSDGWNIWRHVYRGPPSGGKLIGRIEMRCPEGDSPGFPDTIEYDGCPIGRDMGFMGSTRQPLIRTESGVRLAS